MVIQIERGQDIDEKIAAHHQEKDRSRLKQAGFISLIDAYTRDQEINGQEENVNGAGIEMHPYAHVDQPLCEADPGDEKGPDDLNIAAQIE